MGDFGVWEISWPSLRTLLVLRLGFHAWLPWCYMYLGWMGGHATTVYHAGRGCHWGCVMGFRVRDAGRGVVEGIVLAMLAREEDCSESRAIGVSFVGSRWYMQQKTVSRRCSRDIETERAQQASKQAIGT